MGQFIIMIRLRALIFDFGGVLMKTVDHTPRHRWDARLGLAPGTVEQVVHGSDAWREAQTGKISPAAYWQVVRSQLRLGADDLAALQHDYFSGDQLDQTLIELIQRSRAGGYAVALLSNDSPALLTKLYQLGIGSLFDPLIISGEIGVMKPAAEAYQIVLRALGISPQEAVFIDDLRTNIDAAAALGLHTIHYTPQTDLETALATLRADP